MEEFGDAIDQAELDDHRDKWIEKGTNLSLVDAVSLALSSDLLLETASKDS